MPTKIKLLKIHLLYSYIFWLFVLYFWPFIFPSFQWKFKYKLFNDWVHSTFISHYEKIYFCAIPLSSFFKYCFYTSWYVKSDETDLTQKTKTVWEWLMSWKYSDIGQLIVKYVLETWKIIIWNMGKNK